MEKRQRQFDKAIEEWKRRVAEQQTETERWQKEARNHAAECYRIKAQVDEAQQALDALRKDNKNLNGMYHDPRTALLSAGLTYKHTTRTRKAPSGKGHQAKVGKEIMK